MKTINNPSNHSNAPAKQIITNVSGCKARTNFKIRDCFCGTSARKLPGYAIVTAMALAMSTQLVPAQTTINVNSGIAGSYMVEQSYNETRAVDVTVLSAVNLNVTSMTLSGIAGTGTATALIYDYNTENLIASASGNLTGGTITLSISGATLVSGHEYQLGFSGDLDDGTLFNPGSANTLPNPNFPYTESSGLFKIDGAYDGGLSSFVTTANLFEPELSLQVTAAPEPATLALAGLGGLSLLLFRYSRK